MLNLICGIERADELFLQFLGEIQSIIANSRLGYFLRLSALSLVMIIVTATDNVDQNMLLEYFTLVDIFDTLVEIFISPDVEEDLAFDALFILIVLVNYRKNESRNLYLHHLSKLEASGILIPIAYVIARAFRDYSRDPPVAVENLGVLARVTSTIKPWAASSGLREVKQGASTFSSPKACAILLALYEVVHVNSSFCSCCINKTTAPTKSPVPLQAQMNELLFRYASKYPEVAGTEDDLFGYLLSKLMEFCDHLYGNIQEFGLESNAKLSLLILQCFTESDAVNKYLHSKSPHSYELRKSQEGWWTGKKPPDEDSFYICHILHLCQKFLVKNLFVPFRAELYCRCMAVLQRILCYQKRLRLRVKFDWTTVWTSLFRLMKFVATPEKFKLPHVPQLCCKLCQVFNLFITYGDIFLASPSDYDVLYYEIMRSSQIVEGLHELGYKANNRELLQYLSNIRSIISHFSGKLDDWTLNHPDKPLSTEIVMTVIKENYDTLKLTLLPGLDSFEPYLENPHEVQFFRGFTRQLVVAFRDTVQVKPYPVNT